MGCRVINPIVQTLLDHLSVEARIAEAKGDLYKLVWAIMPFVIFEDSPKRDVSNLAKSLDRKAQELADGQDFTGENLLALALSVKVLRLAGHGIHSDVVKLLDTLLRQAEERRTWWKAPEAAGLMAFALVDVPGYRQHLTKLKTTLVNMERLASERHLHPQLIDTQFGLAFLQPGELNTSVFELILGNLETQSLEKIGKFCIVLHKTEQHDYLRKAVLTLENKVRERFQQWVFPNLELTLFEGINLINSNLPVPIVKGILEGLRAHTGSWAANLDVEENAIVITNIDSIARKPSFNPAEDALALMALRYGNRWHYYQLNSEEYERARQGIKALEGKEEYQLVQSCWLKRLMWLSPLLPAVPIILMVTLPNPLPGLENAIHLLKAWKWDVIDWKDTQSLIASILWGAYLVFVLWFISALRVLRNSGEIDKWWQLLWIFRKVKKRVDEFVYEKEE